MSSDEGTLYMIPHASAREDEWITPEPADDVVTDAVVESSDLTPDDVDDLSTYVDLSTLAGVLDGEDDRVSFTVEEREVVVTSDGNVDVTAE